MMKKTESVDHDITCQSSVASTGSAGGTTASSGGGTGARMKMLAEGFVPGEDDVICGRGKKCYNHVGNERFRRRVLTMLDEYSRAKTKLDKSAVLSKLVDQVRNCSPNGGFVKQDNSGRWYEVGDFLAREKSSQAFRDALHERYKSSNVSKKKRRQEEQAKVSEKMTRITPSEYDISSRLDRISSEVLRSRPDSQTFDMFNQANLDMLRRFNTISDVRSPGPRRFQGKSSNPFRGGHPGNSSIGGLGGNSSKSGFGFPDPLFGFHSNTAFASKNAPNSGTLSDSEVYHPQQDHHRPRVQRSHSFSESSSYEPLDIMSDVEPMHHSLPNMDSHRKKEPMDPRASLHFSMPNLDYSESTSAMDLDMKTSQTLDIEPLPLNDYPMVVPSEATVEPEVVKVKLASSESRGCHPGGASYQGISKDLMLCLQKMSDHSLGGSSVFDLEESKHPQQKPARRFTSIADVDEEPLDFAE